jgi:phosphate transport system protein
LLLSACPEYRGKFVGENAVKVPTIFGGRAASCCYPPGPVSAIADWSTSEAASRVLTVPEQRQIFQRQLDDIDAKVIELLDLVAADLARATPALRNGSNEVVKVLAEHRLVIDIFCPEVEKLTRTAILLQAPVASDLRFLLCVLRILPEIERSYHLVVQLPSRASHIRGEDLSPRSRELIERMGSLASDMWSQTADSWYERDHSAAAVLADRDNEMDELHASLIAELSSGRTALAVTIEMALVAPLYERLSHHAVDIADQIIYIAGSGPSVVARN